MTRVAIVWAFADRNRGSAALNLAAIDFARWVIPDAEVGIIGIPQGGIPDHAVTFAARKGVRLLPPLVGSTWNPDAVDFARGWLHGSLQSTKSLGRRGMFDPEAVAWLESSEMVVA